MRSLALVLMLFSACAPGSSPQSDSEGERVILVTLDGLRREELFTGMDPALVDPDRADSLREFNAAEGRTRRRLLMPYFWGQLASEGVVLGNPTLGSEGRVANPHRFSYPGYAELLTGRVLPSIDSNDPIRIPVETVLEYARRKLRVDAEDVACIASWSTFDAICAQDPRAIVINAGVRDLPPLFRGERSRLLAQLQFQILPPWDGVRSDAVTFQIALEYLRLREARLLYLALDDTDDWAHRGRYDRVLQSIRIYDDFLRLLWEQVQTMPAYRGRTTLLVTTDHGRGSGGDWTSHGRDVMGAEFIWLAAIGPHTPGRGEYADYRFEQNQVAATILRLLGLEAQDYFPGIGEPISAVLQAP